MDKSAIRNFAIEARKMLMKSAETEAGFYGVTKTGCKNPIQKGNDFEVYETIAGTENRIYDADIKRRANLVKAVETLGFEQVIEETAYTWFNRIIAIRFMEVNDYLPTRVRVLSSETGSNTPDIVTQSLDVDLNMTPEELGKVQKAKDENRYDDAFRMLFIKQCNELNAILPGLFEKTDDYMELLLKLSYTSDGVVRMLVDSIDENNFNVETEGQVEIIGWMYQYYNTELKAEVFGRPSGAKIKKEDIPAATQLFTPDWIVRYMVENSVGRVWIEHLRALDASLNEQEKAEEYGWKYYLPEAEQEDSVAEKLVEIRKSYAELEPKDITCIDPCMGSGHILVYMFDVLMDIYRSEGFSERDAAFSILEHNIRGLDIDKRAYQLSYFALMMKARGYNRTFFRGKQQEDGSRYFVEPQVLVVDESNNVNRSQLKYFGSGLGDIEKNNAINQINGLLDELVDAKEYGSILDVTSYDWNLLNRFIQEYDIDGQISFDTLGIDETRMMLAKLIKQGKIMADKYYIVSTNPPYMGLSNGSNKLNVYAKEHYVDSKMDLFSVFIEKCSKMVELLGYQAMITQHSWMFLTSFENLRKKLLLRNTINMAHLGTRAFEEIGGEVVQTTSFVFCNSKIKDYKSVFVRLVEPNTQRGKEELYLEKTSQYVVEQDKFQNIPGCPYAYWISENLMRCFDNQKIGELEYPKQGLSSADNNRFLRYWFEVSFDKLRFECVSNENSAESKGKWFPFNKGGEFRKWYGNFDYVINWENNGFELRNFKNAAIRNPEYYFLPHITWSKVSGGNISFRYRPAGSVFSDAGCAAVFDEEIIWYALGLLNSNYAQVVFDLINPTINYTQSTIASLPFIDKMRSEITEIVKENIRICKEEWDMSETSWDFKRHPLLPDVVGEGDSLLSNIYCEYEKKMNNMFTNLKSNEEQLNRMFLEIYGLEDEISDEIDERYVTVKKSEIKKQIRSLISYAVGCLLGRYSLYKDGIAYAGGEWNTDIYGEFMPDRDNCILISDEEYMDDDIVSQFCMWLAEVYGHEYVEENLRFVADNLGVKGNTSREILRNYFINDFIKDHIKMYQKRPVYWMFDSGKQNGFKAIVYMHRYNKDTLNLLRSQYLHKTEDAVENALKNAEYVIQTSASAVERAKATKDRDRYVKQLNEMRIYYQALSHLALQKIEIDLDDGVKHNYQLFQGIEVIADGGKKQKVDLLAKI